MFALLGVFEMRRSVATAISMVLFAGTALGQVRFENNIGKQAAEPSRESRKTVVPDAESQEKANQLMGEIYKDKLKAATSAVVQKRLARELMSTALEMTNDAPSCYVLLREAGSLAFKARDYQLSLEVIDALDGHFDVDALGLRIKIMAAEDANTETSCEDRCYLGFQLMAEAVAKGRLDVAIQMGELAQKAADQSQNKLLIKYVGDCKARLEQSLQERKTETDLLARLRTLPADPEANLALGKLYCFDRGNWEKGISMLALGSDSALRELAQRELERPSTALDW